MMVHNIPRAELLCLLEKMLQGQELTLTAMAERTGLSPGRLSKLMLRYPEIFQRTAVGHGKGSISRWTLVKK